MNEQITDDVCRPTRRLDPTKPSHRALSVAQRLVAAGIKIFPADGCKRPLPPKWNQCATTDVENLQDCFLEQYGSRAETVGIPCGLNNLVVIDCDAKPGKPNGVEGFENLLVELKEKGQEISIDNVPRVITPSGGMHLFFRQPEGVRIGCSAGRLPPGIDVRGDGGQVIAVGSILSSGGQYGRADGSPDLIESFRNGTIPTLPQALADVIGTARTTHRTEQAKLWIGQSFASVEQLKIALSCMANDSRFADYHRWLSVPIAFATLSGGDAEIEQAVDDWSKVGRINRVPSLFEEYRQRGFNTTPQEAAGNLSNWLRSGAVTGREAEAKRVADVISQLVHVACTPTASEVFNDGYVYDPHGPDAVEPAATDGDSEQPAVAPTGEQADVGSAGERRDVVPAYVRELNDAGYALVRGMDGVALVRADGRVSFESLSAFTKYQDRYKLPGNPRRGRGTEWLKNRHGRNYSEMGMWPVGAEPAAALNLWKGLPVEPVPGAWSRLCQFIRDTICSGDAALFEYVLNWCADLLQRPLDKGVTGLAIVGAQGTGKTFFGRLLLSFFPEARVLHLSDQQRVVGRFNEHFENVIFVLADEAFFAKDPTIKGSFKALVTESTMIVEPKFQRARQVPNRTTIIFTSNEELTSVPIEQETGGLPWCRSQTTGGWTTAISPNSKMLWNPGNALRFWQPC